MDEALKCNNLTVGYDGKPVLTDIDFELTRGTLAVLIGANGSGKSTLLRTLAGLQAPIAGNIMLCGSDIDNVSRRQVSRLRAATNLYRSSVACRLMTKRWWQRRWKMWEYRHSRTAILPR